MNQITERLIESRDEGNAAFVAKLNPTVEPDSILGCRTVQMRSLAKQLAKDESRFGFLDSLPHTYYEENILHAVLLPSLSKDSAALFEPVDRFLPFVDNWAVCDTLASSLKVFGRQPDTVCPKVKEWIGSDQPFTVRFGIDVMLCYFLDANFTESVLIDAQTIRCGHYYVDMALAWLLSVALVKQWDSAIPLFESNAFDDWVHNKAIQKACESYRLSPERKELLKGLKVKRTSATKIATTQNNPK